MKVETVVLSNNIFGITISKAEVMLIKLVCCCKYSDYQYTSHRQRRLFNILI